MRIVCVGGGPAGLYFSILAKLSHPHHQVTIIERNPAGVTYGWGVVFWEDLLDDLYRNDPVSAREIADSAARWDQQEVHIRGEQAVHIGGFGFSIGRDRLLEILTRRALSLGVEIQFQRELEDLSEFADADLVVACDGANSKVRRLHASHFQTHIEVGRNKYIWLGTNKLFDAFTFAFEETPAGWLWFHAYRFSGTTSTCIVECPQETWEALGFDTLGPEETLRRLEDIFKRQLAGHLLFNQIRGLGKTPWLNFKRIRHERWFHGNVALMGDAAHTTHFSIGSGTKLAIQDAIGLAGKLRDTADLPSALRAYEEERRTALLPLQNAARSSAEWFENVPRHVEQDTLRFAYALLNRRGGPPWRYPLYLASQQAALRGLLRSLYSARRWVRRGRVDTLAPGP
ncbi:FAD-dependent monooxygenase [Hyalangium rubrum]|uniref:FAD-dependent monooxygenase n=1 Tax=Hyalangium rubrum TaxID=3103134 RepID=A0ABU5HH51_9BACT|nr:FAD-dependent monooxygenase [Hyalangium sp. s54d21]MDY7232791.1 FAD-dependent monooxygenase [Hyalangium sp. s54d21]